MKGNDPKLWIGAASLGFVIALFYHDLERTSPGALSRVHAGVEELEDSSNCALCHGTGEQAMANACLECHAPIGEQIGGASGFHGTLRDGGGADCARCHLEHHGASFEIAGPLAYREAGFDSRDDYDHAALGFELEGRHLQLECAECHALADAPMLDKGQARFLGLDQACDSCHEHSHGSGMLRACVDCHGQSSAFSDLTAFVHSEDIELGGSHAEATCKDCHAAESVHSVEALAGAHALGAPRDCSGCHADPHSEAFRFGIAQLEDRLFDSSCSSCHSPLQASFVEMDSFALEAHAATGLLLEAPHDLACDQCHDSIGLGQPSFLERFPGRSANDCAACHEDPHEGLMGSSCALCHALPHPFQGLGGYDHTSTFPLEGAHGGIGCSDCHDPTSSTSIEALVESGLPANPRVCADCHDSPHRAPFQASVAARLEAPEGTTCANCHDPLIDLHFGNPKTPFEPGLHGASGFPLADPHDNQECSACHGDPGQPFELRYPGRQPGDCAACHQDPHGGEFDRAPYREAGCTACHEATRFHPSRYGVGEHETAAFQLEGSHRAVPCSSCHLSTPERSGLPPAFHDAPRQCSECHLDAHGGAFDLPRFPLEVSGDTDCARCHLSTVFSDYREERFDHGFWTDYPLLGAHASASCKACHHVRPGPELGARRFGVTLGSDCQACHADPHVGQFAQSGITDCAACHASTQRFSELLFDHDEDSSFALDAQHRGVACASCHRPWPLPGGGTVVRYKPLGTTCGDCHTTREGGRRIK